MKSLFVVIIVTVTVYDYYLIIVDGNIIIKVIKIHHRKVPNYCFVFFLSLLFTSLTYVFDVIFS